MTHKKREREIATHYFIGKIYFNTFHLIILHECHVYFHNFHSVLFYSFVQCGVCVSMGEMRKLHCKTIYYWEIKIWTIWCSRYCGFVADIIHFVSSNTNFVLQFNYPFFFLVWHSNEDAWRWLSRPWCFFFFSLSSNEKIVAYLSNHFHKNADRS